MKNRIAHLLHADEPPEHEYFELVATYGRFYIDRATGLELGRQLRRLWPPRWVRFTDLFGSSILLRLDSVSALQESTPQQRSGFREFQRQEHEDDLKEWRDQLGGLEDDWKLWHDDDDICPV
jgi:aminoglycoside phosphotransferase (APT) family kinase protein